MAINAPRIGSGRSERSDPAYRIGPHHVGPQGGHGCDPVADMPQLAALTAPLARIERTRIVNGGGWSAVGMRLRKAPGAVDLFEIFLSAGGPRQLVIAVLDEDEAVAAWRALGRSSNLPLVLETETGEVLRPYPQIGAVALGQNHVRRKHSFLKRRPRFLVCRKAGFRGLEQVTVAGTELLPGKSR
jgi:hypothetical protein